MSVGYCVLSFSRAGSRSRYRSLCGQGVPAPTSSPEWKDIRSRVELVRTYPGGSPLVWELEDDSRTRSVTESRDRHVMSLDAQTNFYDYGLKEGVRRRKSIGPHFRSVVTKLF